MAFLETVGQSEIKLLLSKSLDLNQVPHSQCFIDRGGRGGLALAIDFAISLLGDSLSGNKSSRLQHPDLHFVFPVATSAKIKSKPLCNDYLVEWREFVTSNPYGSIYDWLQHIGADNKQGIIPVDETNALFKALSLKAYMGKNKVCVLWGLNRLKVDAANKLLKLIEEPPANTYFILVAEDENDLLPTIKSRCQLVQLPPLNSDTISNELVQNGVSLVQANSIASNAEGNLHWAKKQVESIDEIKDREALLIEVLRLSFQIRKNKQISLKLMLWANKASQLSRPQLKEFFEFGLSFIRKSLLLSYTSDSLVFYESLNGFSLQKFAPYVHSKNAQKIISLFEECLYAVERNASSKILLSDFAIQLGRLLNTKES